MTHPDDATVVRVLLAEREGWTEIDAPRRLGKLPQTGQTMWLPDYPHSTDAIRPVLLRLTPEEWAALHRIVSFMPYPPEMEKDNARAFVHTKFLLTLPPYQLSRAVASAIQACAGQKGGG